LRKLSLRAICSVGVLLFSLVALPTVNVSAATLNLNSTQGILAKVVTLPSYLYIEEKWEGGQWVVTYSKTYKTETINYPHGFTVYRNPYDETVYYNTDGTYSRRTYYETRTFQVY
jgi:hypothetical protein